MAKEIDPFRDPRPGEFGGVPDLYGNVDYPQAKGLGEVGITGVLAPHQERMALTQTRPDIATSTPSHGTGGEQVQP